MIRRIALAILAALSFGAVRTVAHAQPAQWSYSAPGNTATATYPGNVVILGNCTGCTGGSQPLVVNCGTLTLSSQVCLNVSGTWNAGAQTFTAFKVNMTDTASAAGSKLADLQIGGSSRFAVSKAGAGTFASTITATGATLSSFAGSGVGCVAVDNTGLLSFLAAAPFTGCTQVDFPNNWSGIQTFAGGTASVAINVDSASEIVTITGAAPSATTNYDVLTQSVQYYTTNAANNWTLNIRGSSSSTMDTVMATGQSVTFVMLATQGGTAYYNNVVQVDGTTSGVTTKWQGGAPSGGNTNGVDAYTYTVVKTGAATFTVFASLAAFS